MNKLNSNVRFFVEIDTTKDKDSNYMFIEPWLILDDQDLSQLLGDSDNILTTEDLIREGYITRQDAENKEAVYQAYTLYLNDLEDLKKSKNANKKEIVMNDALKAITDEVKNINTSYSFIYKLNMISNLFESMLTLHYKASKDKESIRNILKGIQHNVINTTSEKEQYYIDDEFYSNLSYVDDEDIAKLTYFLELLIKYINKLYQSLGKELPSDYIKSEKIIKDFMNSTLKSLSLSFDDE